MQRFLASPQASDYFQSSLSLPQGTCRIPSHKRSSSYESNFHGFTLIRGRVICRCHLSQTFSRVNTRNLLKGKEMGWFCLIIRTSPDHTAPDQRRSEEHTSELQSLTN